MLPRRDFALFVMNYDCLGKLSSFSGNYFTWMDDMFSRLETIPNGHIQSVVVHEGKGSKILTYVVSQMVKEAIIFIIPNTWKKRSKGEEDTGIFFVMHK